jgi:alpha-tubulin suppressor-like RCC1 family protein
MKKTQVRSSVALLVALTGCWFPRVDVGDLPDNDGSGGHRGGAQQTGGRFTGGTGGESGSHATPSAIVAVGWYHGCAALADGSVWCWGSNNAGMLPPARVQGLTHPAATVDADYTESCALSDDGWVECWGSSAYGALANSATLGRVRQISLGEYHTCALLLDGSIDCWGSNVHGQLGDGTRSDHSTPQPVPGIDSALQVSAGAALTCALLPDRSVSCWGNNSGSDVCDGLNVVHTSPTAVDGLTDVTQISAGSGHACARHGDGGVSCWGVNFRGEAGVGEPGSPAQCDNGVSRPPARVAGVEDAIQVAAGDTHTCALNATGTVLCWGDNRAGQLGDGTTTSHAAPAPVLGIDSAVKISAGFTQTCALLADASVWCWGVPADAGVVTNPEPLPKRVEFN